MQFTSHFNLGDQVYHIHSVAKQVFVECPSCEGGFISTKTGTKIECPQCDSKGVLATHHKNHYTVHPRMLTVGEVRVEVNNKEYDEEYMCIETGVGSGSIYKVENLFRTEQEAQAACDKKNNRPENTPFICTRCHPEFSSMYTVDHEHRYCAVHGHTRMLNKAMAEQKKKERDERHLNDNLDLQEIF